MTELRAWTLYQPMASAIAAGVKRWENRPRRMIGQNRALPQWVALHAGLGEWPMDEGELDTLWPEHPPVADLPRGQLLGVMLITKVVRYHPRQRIMLISTDDEREVLRDPWCTGPWCHRVDMFHPLEQPIPARGFQGAWTPPAHALPSLLALIPPVRV